MCLNCFVVYACIVWVCFMLSAASAAACELSTVHCRCKKPDMYRTCTKYHCCSGGVYRELSNYSGHSTYGITHFFFSETDLTYCFAVRVLSQPSKTVRNCIPCQTIPPDQHRINRTLRTFPNFSPKTRQTRLGDPKKSAETEKPAETDTENHNTARDSARQT